MESELENKEKYWSLLEKDYAIQDELIALMKTANEHELLCKLPHYVKALALSTIVHDTAHFTIHWFDGIETDITI